MEANSNSKEAKQPRRSRARQADGTYRGDNPATPELNEAWVSQDIEAGLEKPVKYTVKHKVNGTSNDTTGKYHKREAIRPAFGTVHTITY
jgi:hypothetical protein